MSHPDLPAHLISPLVPRATQNGHRPVDHERLRAMVDLVYDGASTSVLDGWAAKAGLGRPTSDQWNFALTVKRLQGAAARKPTPTGASAIDGAKFALDAPTEVPATWGHGTQVLAAQGEPTMLCGPEGVGKTTLLQQLALRQAEIGVPELLGHPVAVAERKVLYLALDRPRQSAQSMRRMVGESDRAALESRLVVWTGSLPFDVLKEPRRLAAFAQEHGAGTVFVDCLKDLAAGLSDEDTGIAIDAALKARVEAGIEVFVSHHQRKAQADNKKPKTLADVYGSRWLTAGCGSVVLLWGQPGDPIVELNHLKQPADSVGPLTLLHDNRRGTTTVADAPDVVEIVLAQVPEAATAKSVAAGLFRKKEPSRNDIEKARRRLDGEVDAGRLERRDGDRVTPTTYTFPGGSRGGSRGSREGVHGEGHAGPLRSRPSVNPAGSQGARSRGGVVEDERVDAAGVWVDGTPERGEAT
jgi:replicative DNA helicase